MLKTQTPKLTKIRSHLLSAFSFQLSAAGPNAPGVIARKEVFSPSQPFRSLRIVIAGGGTGGHLFPGIALAQEFLTRNSENNIIFVSRGNPLERSLLSKTNFTLESITVEGIKGRGLWNQARSLTKLPKGIFESIRILRKFRPDVAVGLGSYSAGPTVFAAWLLGIKTVLHEQNLLPGITNRILARFADRIYVSFENTKTRFDPQKVQVTGNPVRADILKSIKSRKEQVGTETEQKPFTILIIGGSQGAHSINTAVTEILEHLTNKEKLYFIHQTGAADEKWVQNAYRSHGIDSKVQSFFEQMAPLYQNADLIICRAGATTVAEITAIGKAVIFVPFPFATDNHQVLNANTLSSSGAAEMILEKDLNGKILRTKIDYYVSNRSALNDMALKAREFGNPDAAKDIVDDVYKLIVDGCGK